jgi:hypothetical protein
MKKRLANNRGVLLVEIMVACLFVAIAGVSLSIMFDQGRSMINETRHRIYVLNRVQSQMERLIYLKNQNNGQVPLSENGFFTDTLVLRSPDEPTTIIPLTGEIIMVPSSQTNSSGIPLFYDITVVYTWTDVAGQQCDVALRGLY